MYESCVNNRKGDVITSLQVEHVLLHLPLFVSVHLMNVQTGLCTPSVCFTAHKHPFTSLPCADEPANCDTLMK